MAGSEPTSSFFEYLMEEPIEQVAVDVALAGVAAEQMHDISYH
jgi:hypothetical protein